MSKYEFRSYEDKVPKCKYCNKELFFYVEDGFCSNKCKSNYNQNVLKQCEETFELYKKLRRKG